MFINIPTKNIYVSEADMELFERAAQHAESVSAAVVQALQHYLTNRDNTEKGYGRIELALYENGSRRKVMFYGREIVRVERPVDGGVRINTIYETAKRAACCCNKKSAGFYLMRLKGATESGIILRPGRESSG